MIWRDVWTQPAVRARDRIHPKDRERILAAVKRFVELGQGDVVALKGRPGQYRLRAGDFRVLFALDNASQTMVIQDVAHRREVYR